MGSDVNSIIIIILIAFLLWLIGLTVVFYRLLSHYRRVAGKVSQGDLLKLIDKLIDSNDKFEKDYKSVKKDIEKIFLDLKKPIQKVGINKYNPFNEIGGDQSFSVSLLDQDENGFILTSLHTRDRTRVYMKPVDAGESKYELSKDEEKALKLSKKQK